MLSSSGMCVNSFGYVWDSVFSAKASLSCHGSAVQGGGATQAAYGDGHFLPSLVGLTWYPVKYFNS